MRTLCFIIKRKTLPKDIQDEVHEWERFNNNGLVELYSELNGEHHKGITAIEDYFKDQCETNNYRGDINAFINDYNLLIDKWLIDQKFDLTGVKKILIDCSW